VDLQLGCKHFFPERVDPNRSQIEKQRCPHFILFIDLLLSTTHSGSRKLLLVRFKTSE
jgi:hypothetical protein